MAKHPPSEFARLEIFCALVDAYDELATAFPVEQSSFNFGGPARPPADRWHRMVRATALRKFVLGRSDQVYVGTVLRAITACAASDDPVATEVVDAFSNGLDRVGTVACFSDSFGDYDAAELVEDFIYGGLLHGDYGRWQRATARGYGLMTEMPLWQFTADAETLVRRLRDAIRLGIAEDALQDRTRSEDQRSTSCITDEDAPRG